MSESNRVRELLTPERVQLQVQVADWREAIEVAGSLLAESGATIPAYTQAMISNVEKLGPYIVIAPGLAMPHGSPDQGVLSSALALVSLATPVEFGHSHNDPVSVVLALASNAHEGHLQELALVAQSIQEILKLGKGWEPLLSVTDISSAIDLLSGDGGDQQ